MPPEMPPAASAHADQPATISTSANSRPVQNDTTGPGEITADQVSHLANLARIRLTSAEITKLTGELKAIVDNVAKVIEVATPDVPATSHPIPLQNVYRPDVVGVTLTQEQALSGAPDHDGSRFRVSAILGEEQ
ncbi:aspartyl-tRNA(Asn)/glutamyl-tRNA(Gln) amidotransferase subunit C [Subtercola frigoramans]|uniref:Aspartyl/glutamyl-tRNA(Asn/Gln) amidotransferase subunit C n=1 Tax=Subtercola frigoramans TaxID=120298 RepID=A0ABS2L6T0_9MICO|nr:aspartyl-tRNA(Asn)/glutamyl-tRNA(Gln) amidotransferase subunit C [Subtercola frigoramans]